MTNRRYVFTLNNPDVVTALFLPQSWPDDKIKYCLYQLELGESGTRHLQGYLELLQPMREAAMRKWCPLAHWEVAIGNRIQCLAYCSKELTRLENPWFFDGVKWINCGDEHPESLRALMMPASSAIRSSRSSSLSSKLSSIKERLSNPNCVSTEEIADEEFELWVRYYRAFEKFLVMKTPARNHAVEVHVVQGPTGTGKSRWAMESFPGAYWKQRSNWWDGYAGHDTVIIDEFYGWLPFDLLLRICDRYPLLVETKGGQMQFVAKTIVITTNALPSSWYKSCAYFPALVRRITKWHVMPIFGCHSQHDTYQAFSMHAVENLIMP